MIPPIGEVRASEWALSFPQLCGMLPKRAISFSLHSKYWSVLCHWVRVQRVARRTATRVLGGHSNRHRPYKPQTPLGSSSTNHWGCLAYRSDQLTQWHSQYFTLLTHTHPYPVASSLCMSPRAVRASEPTQKDDLTLQVWEKAHKLEYSVPPSRKQTGSCPQVAWLCRIKGRQTILRIPHQREQEMQSSSIHRKDLRKPQNP